MPVLPDPTGDDSVAYLDHAATTPMRPEAVEAMLPFLTQRYANPSGAHLLARDSRRAVDEARDVVAEAVGAEPGEVVFTGGGTEADNMAVLGAHDLRGGVVVGSAIEHHAVLDPVLARGGRLVAVDASGVIDLDALAATLDPDVSIVSVMAVNNEVGTIQPLAEVAAFVRDLAPAALLHTDAIQALCWTDLTELTAVADLVSVSAHKFGGPKGVGALVIRGDARVAPRVLGGGQERERRSGTQNVAGIVAMATAAKLTVDERPEAIERVRKLRDRLAEGLVASIDGLVETGGQLDPSVRAAGICHVCIEGVESEALLYLLESSGVYASAASSCASGAMEPSHVLEAMGVAPALAKGSLRLSLGHETTDADIDLALAAIPPAVERLRLFS